MECYKNFAVGYLLSQVPDELVDAELERIVNGACPVCNGDGPNDLHGSYQVWSLAVITSWKTVQRISCVPCARRKNMRDCILSFGLGWWALPAGVFCTPMQIARNLKAIRAREAWTAPSEALRYHVRYQLMEELLAAGRLTLELPEQARE
jgi:hypothetical protein